MEPAMNLTITRISKSISKSRPKTLPKSIYAFAFFLGALLLAPKATLAAPTVVTKTGFTLTYPDGWVSPTPSRDSTYLLMNTATSGAVAYGDGVPLASSLSAAVYVNNLTVAFTAAFQRIDSTNKTLGAYPFVVTTLKDTSASSDSTGRVKIYITTKGNYLFVSWLVYSVADQAAVVAQQEAALASLNITAVAGILSRSTVRGSAADSRPGFDVQGRTLKPMESRIPRSVWFRKL